MVLDRVIVGEEVGEKVLLTVPDREVVMEVVTLLVRVLVTVPEGE